MTIEFQQIVNLQLPLYIDGLNLSVASNTVIAMAPGQARDSSDQLDIPVGFSNYDGAIQPANPSFLNCPNPLFINSAIVGPNGIDQGALAASSNYIVYLIADPSGFKAPAGLISLYSNQFPLLPAGYGAYRAIGYVSTDGSIHFLAASILNVKAAKSFFLQPAVSVLSGGNSTTFAAVALTTPVPTTTDPFVIAYLNVIFTPAAVGDVVQLRPTGSGSGTANLVTIVGLQAGVAQTECVAVMTGVSGGEPSIDYKVTASGDSVSILVEGYSVTLS
jgi:hypothetical protein